MLNCYITFVYIIYSFYNGIPKDYSVKAKNIYIACESSWLWVKVRGDVILF